MYQHNKLRLRKQIGEFLRSEEGLSLAGLAAVVGTAPVTAFASIHPQTQMGDGAKPFFEGFVLFGR